MRKFLENIQKKSNNKIQFSELYNEENILIENLMKYMKNSEYIEIISEKSDDLDIIYDIIIKDDEDIENNLFFYRYHMKFSDEFIKIYQYSDNNDEFEIFSIYIYEFEYDLESILEFLINYLRRKIKYENYKIFYENFDE